MAASRRKKKQRKKLKKRRRAVLCGIVAVLVLLAAVISLSEENGGALPTAAAVQLVRVARPCRICRRKRRARLKVHFIDVGQGDAVLLEQNGAFALIDAGEREAADGLVAYLQAAGVAKLDLLVMTPSPCGPYRRHAGRAGCVPCGQGRAAGFLPNAHYIHLPESCWTPSGKSRSPCDGPRGDVPAGRRDAHGAGRRCGPRKISTISLW